MSSLAKCNAAHDALLQQEALQQEYVNNQLAAMRCRMNDISYAFPRVTEFPAPWKLIHTLVYDFLGKLNLQGTLTVFTAESEMGATWDILETGWFLKSFVMHPNFHSVLMFLLAQFNSAADRISLIVQAERCNQQVDCDGSCDRALACISENVLEQRAVDASRFCEAQRIIAEQRANDCHLREDQARKEAECRQRQMCQQQRSRSCETSQAARERQCREEQCRQEQCRQEQCRQEQCRQEQERKCREEQCRLEQERLEQERRCREEQCRQEQERLEQEKRCREEQCRQEQLRQEQERRCREEQCRQEQLRQEQERQEQERRCREEQCRQEQCRLEQERQEQERRCREEQCRQEQQRLEQERLCREEQCRQERALQECAAKRQMEEVCNSSRNKILQEIRERNCQQDRNSASDLDAHRARLQRERECDRVAQEQQRAMSEAMANTRQRIVREYAQQQQDLADGCVDQNQQSQDHFQMPNEADIVEMCNRAGLDGERVRASRRWSVGGGSGRGGSGGRGAGDPRQNQSFRAVHRNQHTGWRMEPLGDLLGGQLNCSDPEIVVTGSVENVMVLERDGLEEEVVEEEEEVCEHHPVGGQRDWLRPPVAQRGTRPSGIPRIYQERISTPSQHAHYHHQHHNDRSQTQAAGNSRRRSSRGGVPRHSVPAQMCPCRLSAQQGQKEDREAEDYVHFSRRQPSRRRRASRAAAAGRQDYAMDCIREA